MSDNIRVINLNKGEVLASSGNDTEFIYYIIGGTLKAYTSFAEFIYGPGEIVGTTDAYYGINSHTYVAETDCAIEAYPFNTMSDLSKVFSEHKPELAGIVIKNNAHMLELIKCYLSLMMKCRFKDSSYSSGAHVNRWELDKYNSISSVPSDVMTAYFSSGTAINVAEMAESARLASSINDACLEMADFLGINMDYIPEEPEKEAPISMAPSDFFSGDTDLDFNEEEVMNALTGSFDAIMSYSQADSNTISEFGSLMHKFKSSSAKLSSDDDMRELRRHLSRLFYDIYYNVFMHSVQDDNLPAPVKMFLNFGYIDEELLSKDNLTKLYKFSFLVDNICNDNGVYTIYNWLKHILWGEKEPSNNNLDQSYDEYIREQIRLGKIEDQGILNDTDSKLRFEIQNMFIQTNRMTYGKASSFVPFMIEENILSPLGNMLLTADYINKFIDNVKSIDFSLFYRSAMYTNEKLGIPRESIYIECLPDIILTPCIGTYGVMWQEIVGRNRNTGGRFMLPIFCSVKPESLIYNILGHFRWELCKRIQGNYWNNVSEKSLTSEYYDYLQFYRKNRDLSDPVKDKLKSTMTSARNNFSEVFARDYEQWISYESSGSNRLNKVSRLIMSKYCPFVKDIRDKLKMNPSYTKGIEIYEKNCAIQLNHFGLLCRSLAAKGLEVPDEIKKAMEYLSR